MKYIEAKDQRDLGSIQRKAIAAIGKGREAMQVALVATICHIAKCGNRTGAMELMETLHSDKTYNKQAVQVKDWLVRFGGLEYDGKTKNFVGWKGAQYIIDNLDIAKAAMWWEKAKDEAAFTGFDADKALQKVCKRYREIQEELPTMADENRAKVHLIIQRDTLNQLLDILGVDNILAGIDKAQPAQAA